MKASIVIRFCLVCCLGFYLGSAQVKIGENLQLIDASSILELESTSRALILTRVTNAEMSAIAPLNGALVYNTDAKCIYMFDGSLWKSLCNGGMSVITSVIMPVVNQVGDIWINTAQNEVSIWNGTGFVLINRNPRSGSGIPSPLTVINPLAGDLYVDRDNGNLYTHDGTNWILQGNGIFAANGITKTTTNTIELGGTLTRPTLIETDNTNTMAIEGLETVNDPRNMLVTIDSTTNILKKTPISSLVQKEEILNIASKGQNLFNTPQSITDSKKIDVYRNGVKINFTVVDSNTIALYPEATCFQNDEIRIIQFF